MTYKTKKLIGAILISTLALGFLWQAKNKPAPMIAVISPLAADVFATETVTQFAVIGDYGKAGLSARRVAEMVTSWQPDFIITTGDNNYNMGAAATLHQNIGRYYEDYLDAENNRFYPSLGNHDWNTVNAQPYLNYFPISESEAVTNSSDNERYYDFVQGSIHFFAVDSSRLEPDGSTKDSPQALWLQTQLRASTAAWQIVYFHHPPYSSGDHGSTERMRWPFREWGADVVLTGHDHNYERLLVDGLPYFVNGLGGKSIRGFGTAVSGSQFRFNGDYGAMLGRANTDTLVLEFYSVRDWQRPVDRLILTSASALPDLLDETIKVTP